MPSTQFDREQIKKLYQQIPQNLRDALASLELAEKVDEICQKYGVEDTGAIDVVYRLCGDVLLGILPLDQLETAITREVKIRKDQLSPFMRELNRYVFYPYKPELNQLYGVKPAFGEESTPQLQQPQAEEGYVVPAESQEGIQADEEPTELKKEDKYRETIE